MSDFTGTYWKGKLDGVGIEGWKLKYNLDIIARDERGTECHTRDLTWAVWAENESTPPTLAELGPYKVLRSRRPRGGVVAM